MELGHPRRHRQGGLNALLVAIALCFGGPGAWAAGPKYLFDIPAGDAQKTLQEFYNQSKIEILYLIDVVRDTKTNAVFGNLDASEALEQMLKDTHLEYSFEEDFSFVSITPRAALPGGAAEQPPVMTASTRIDSRDLEWRNSEFARLTGIEQKLEEVVVTGTLIRGVLDIMSPLEFVTKRDMKKTSYATVQDALQTLPFNFGGGPSEDISTVGNFARGSSVNLRGLGAGATLVLVNGRRQPYSGYEADFVDLSNIAWSAVDRIEVLPDGASALYGSDAIAGVVNIIMRNDFEGAETQVRLGKAPGGGDERLIGQLFGTSWDTGNVLLSYQFSERTALAAADRAYAASSDKRSFGGADYRSNRSNPGNILDPLTFLPVLAIPADQDGTSLTTADLIPSSVNLQNQYLGVELLPDRRMHSVFVSASQEVGERLELFAEGRFNNLRMEQDVLAADRLLVVPRTNPFSPYKGVKSAIVSYSFLDDLGPLQLRARTDSFFGTFGAEADFAESWKARLTGSYGRETLNYAGHNEVNSAALRAALADSNPETAFNPFGDGSFTNPETIESIRAVQRQYSRSSITTANLGADGELFDLRTGAVKLAAGVEWRKEQLARGSTVRRSFDRDVESAYAELAVPLVGQAGDARAVPRLELSLAGRHERYSDFGDSTDPKIGLRWAPLESVKLRTSWGTSFKAPKLVNVYDLSNNAIFLATVPDPQATAGTSLVLAIQGNNPGLKEETASTWTAGLDLAPAGVNGLQISLTYYSIDYDSRILVPGPIFASDILVEEDRWSDVIQRNPQQADVEAACASNPLSGMTLDQCLSTPVSALVDFRVRNMASTRVRGIDLKFDQSVRTRYGRFDFGLDGGYVLSFRQAVSNTSPMNDVIDTVGNPLAFRLRGTAEWYQRDWNQPGFGFGAVLDRFGGYRDPSSDIVSRIAPFTTLDLRLSYRTANGAGAFDGIEFGLNAANVFDNAPPFVDDRVGYDAINADPYGRVVSVNIQKSW